MIWQLEYVDYVYLQIHIFMLFKILIEKLIKKR